MSKKVYQSAAEKQAAYRERKKLVEGAVKEFSYERPVGVSKDEWAKACERAVRARGYAEKMPEQVKPSEVRYQDPAWQLEHEVRGQPEVLEVKETVELIVQHCEGCGGYWSASIEIPCVYCDGTGKRKPQDTRWAAVKVLEPIV
jgi:hypothetical protein